MNLRFHFLLFLLAVTSVPFIPVSLPGQQPSPLNRRSYTNDDVVGSLNGETIHRRDVEEFVLMRHRQESSKLYLGYEGQGEAFEDMALLTACFDEAKEAVGSNQELKNWKKRRYQMFVINDYLKSIQEQPVTEEMLRDYYERNPNEFQMPEERLVRHIFKEVPEGASDEKATEVRQKIEDVRQKIMDGAEFAEVAEEESEVPSAEDGGSIGWIYPHTLKMKPFVDATFSLETGVVSPIVETPYGYHIILVEDTRPPGTIPFEKVVFRGRLEKQIRDERARQDVQVYMAEIASESEITTTTLELDSPEAVLFEIDEVPYTLGDYFLYYTMIPQVEWKNAAEMDIRISKEMLNEAIYGQLIYNDVIKNERIPKERREKARDVVEKWTYWRAYLQKMVEDVDATAPERVQEYYDVNAARFIERASVELSRITIDADLTEEMTIGQRKRAMDRALLEAQEVKKEIDSSMDFAEAARKFSDAADKETGGYLGMITDDDIGPYLQNASLDLEQGEVSDPFETRTGYILVKLHRRTEERTKTVEEARETIEGILRFQAQDRIRTALLEDLMEEGVLEIDEDMFL